MTVHSESFPNSFKAIAELDASERRSDDFLWRAADAVLEECGAPGPDGVNNGTGDKMKALAAELKQAGLNAYKIDWVKKVRKAAHVVPAGRRLPGVVFWAHEPPVTWRHSFKRKSRRRARS